MTPETAKIGRGIRGNGWVWLFQAVAGITIYDIQRGGRRNSFTASVFFFSRDFKAVAECLEINEDIIEETRINALKVIREQIKLDRAKRSGQNKVFLFDAKFTRERSLIDKDTTRQLTGYMIR